MQNNVHPRVRNGHARKTSIRLGEVLNFIENATPAQLNVVLTALRSKPSYLAHQVEYAFAGFNCNKRRAV